MLKQLTEVLAQISDLLYQGNVEYAYKMLGVVLGELGQVIGQVGDSSQQQELMEYLMVSVQAMESGDYILLADLIWYELRGRLVCYEEE